MIWNTFEYINFIPTYADDKAHVVEYPLDLLPNLSLNSTCFSLS